MTIVLPWAERYRPQTISDIIAPTALLEDLKQLGEAESLPNLLFSGPPGVGKTSAAKALCEDRGVEYLVINGSLNGNIDTLRTDIMTYASAISLTGKKKVIILDEADHLNAQSTQPALRNFMEEYSKNCTFILTCNYPNRIIKPLHSRLARIDFDIAKSDMQKIAGAMFKRTCEILEREDVTYEKSFVAQLITTHFPDFRRVLNELDRRAQSRGRVLLCDEETTGADFPALFQAMSAQDFNAIRKWVATERYDHIGIFRQLYDALVEAAHPSSLPGIVVTLAEYQYKEAFVTDSEINLTACLVEIMVEIRWK